MKKIILLAQLLFCGLALFAQNIGPVPISKLPVIGISAGISLHFVSPEKIAYVDLSSTSIVGDLPEKNILRVKVVADSASSLLKSKEAGLVTIVGETFMAQYRLCYLAPGDLSQVSSRIEILPDHMSPIDVSSVGLSSNDIKASALASLKIRAKAPVKSVSAFGIEVVVNRISTIGDYTLLDLGFTNSTNLPFEVDELRMKLEDKKVNKSTNVQSIEIKPVFELYPFVRFKRSYRNIYAIKKVSFPGDRVFNIELSEKQLSGRNLKLSLRYSDLLNAETF